MPTFDAPSLLNQKLSEELASIERSLATTVVDETDDYSFNISYKGDPGLDITNGTLGHISSSPPFGLEIEPSPESLDAQVRYLTEIQKTTIKNVEEHNATLRAQYDTLLKTFHTMTSDFKSHMSLYRSVMDQENSASPSSNLIPIADHINSMQSSVENLKLEMKTLTQDVADIKNTSLRPLPPRPVHVPPMGNVVTQSGVPISAVYSSYMG